MVARTLLPALHSSAPNCHTIIMVADDGGGVEPCKTTSGVDAILCITHINITIPSLRMLYFLLANDFSAAVHLCRCVVVSSLFAHTQQTHTRTTDLGSMFVLSLRHRSFAQHDNAPFFHAAVVTCL